MSSGGATIVQTQKVKDVSSGDKFYNSFWWIKNKECSMVINARVSSNLFDGMWKMNCFLCCEVLASVGDRRHKLSLLKIVYGYCLSDWDLCFGFRNGFTEMNCHKQTWIGEYKVVNGGCDSVSLCGL